MLVDFLRTNRTEIIRRARTRVTTRFAPRATEIELTEGIPILLDQMIDTLNRESTENPFPADDIGEAASAHGTRLLALGFTVAQVVHDYGDVCQAVTELADELDVAISAEDFHVFNRCLDDAIAGAVTGYAKRHDDQIAHLEIERLGKLAHELRNQLSAVSLSFRMLRKGTVGVAGSTGGVIERTLLSMSKLIDRSLAEVRFEVGTPTSEPVRVAELVEDVEIWAAMDAEAHGLKVKIEPVPFGLVVMGDRQLLASALQNLLQNAFKFTRAGGEVRLTTQLENGRVLLEVEDQCGGLPAGAIETIFKPFSQKGGDRSGLGLGLGIAQHTVTASRGELRVRDLPGKGCIFTIDLPVVVAVAQGPAVH